MKQLSKEDQKRIDDGVTVTIGVNLKKVEETAHKEGFNEALEEVKKVFSPVFQIAPSAENIIPIIEAFKKSFEEIEKLNR